MEDKKIDTINGYDVMVGYKEHDGKTAIFLCLQHQETGERGWPPTFGRPIGFVFDSNDMKGIELATTTLVSKWGTLKDVLCLMDVLKDVP